MNRRGYRSGRSTPMWVRTSVVLLAIFFLFLTLVSIFRSRRVLKPDSAVRTSDDIVAELTGGTASEVPSHQETPRGIPEETTLQPLLGGAGSAVAKRVFENGFYTHTILARDLPAIDEGREHYQAWLIRPYPFDFLATGSLVHNVDGSWGMLWLGDALESYDAFVEVLITREPSNDFDENPSADQVLKGRF